MIEGWTVRKAAAEKTKKTKKAKKTRRMAGGLALGEALVLVLVKDLVKAQLKPVKAQLKLR